MDAEFVALLEQGRSFPGSWRVRLGDVNARGRLRFDALARVLQDIATDDAVDAGMAEGWVLRKMALRIHRFPQFRDSVDLVTWCSGTTASAAERRTTLHVAGELAVDAVALWVFVGPDGRPVRLNRAFFEPYGVASGTRRISTRLRHVDPPGGLDARPWPLRAVDVDVLEHVNNAVSLAALEDAVVRAGLEADLATLTLEVEYRAAIEPDDSLDLVILVGADSGEPGLDCWLVCAGTVRTSMRLRLPGPPSTKA